MYLVTMDLKLHSVFTDALGIRPSRFPLVAIIPVRLGLMSRGHKYAMLDDWVWSSTTIPLSY